MTISFSGLASGLDTSSWIESLVKLKQAKVTTYAQKKEEVQLSKTALADIKTYFTNFRASLQKVTDAKFGLSTNLFAQRIATSSNVSKLTATVTSQAEEGTYKIDIEKLATTTQAKSRYNTVVTHKTTATESSKLNTLLRDEENPEQGGIRSGAIKVNVNGVEKGIYVSSNETLSSFTEKLKEAGVDANYNASTGRFSMNIGVSDITDVENTGIVQALKLADVNEGYTSENILMANTVESAHEESAVGTTKLTEIGVETGTLTVNGEEFTIGEYTTIDDLVGALNTAGIYASFSDGIFEMEDAEITEDVVGTSFIDSLGLEDTVYSTSQTSKVLNEAASVITVNATGTTVIKDGEGEAIDLCTSGLIFTASEIDENGELRASVPEPVSYVSAMSPKDEYTLQDLMDFINNNTAGTATLTDGVLQIKGGSISTTSGDLETILGLSSTTSANKVSSSSAVNYMQTIYTPESMTGGNLTIAVNNL